MDNATAKALTGYMNNTSFYADEIIKIINKQMEDDFNAAEAANKIAEFASPACNRFVALACVKESAEWIQIFLKNMSVNLQTVVNCNKILREK